MNIFSRKNSSFDLENGMEQALVKMAETEINRPIEKLASAVDYLNRAAEIFDEFDFEKEAEITTRLLEVFAAKKSKKKPASKSKSKSQSKSKSSKSKTTKKPAAKKKTTDEATKDLDSEKMISNLLEKGWLFNADDIDTNLIDDAEMEEDLDFADDIGKEDAISEGNKVDDMMNADDEHEAELARIMAELQHPEMSEEEKADFEDE